MLYTESGMQQEMTAVYTGTNPENRRFQKLFSVKGKKRVEWYGEIFPHTSS